MVPVAFNTPPRSTFRNHCPANGHKPATGQASDQGASPKPTYDPQWASLGPVHEDTQDFAQSMAIYMA